MRYRRHDSNFDYNYQLLATIPPKDREIIQKKFGIKLMFASIKSYYLTHTALVEINAGNLTFGISKILNLNHWGYDGC